jgi:hypothetical protein
LLKDPRQAGALGLRQPWTGELGKRRNKTADHAEDASGNRRKIKIKISISLNDHASDSDEAAGINTALA